MANVANAFHTPIHRVSARDCAVKPNPHTVVSQTFTHLYMNTRAHTHTYTHTDSCLGVSSRMDCVRQTCKYSTSIFASCVSIPLCHIPGLSLKSTSCCLTSLKTRCFFISKVPYGFRLLHTSKVMDRFWRLCECCAAHKKNRTQYLLLSCFLFDRVAVLPAPIQIQWYSFSQSVSWTMKHSPMWGRYGYCCRGKST